MKAWIRFNFPEEEIQFLRSHCPRDVEILHGEEIPRPADFDVLVAGIATREEIAASDRLRLFIVPWAGIPASTREVLTEFPAIPVHNIHHNASATAEMAVTLLLAAAKATVPRDRDFRQNGWPARMWHDRSAMLLEKKTALVLGYGEIGRRVARACRALDMDVIATRRHATGETREENGVLLVPGAHFREYLPRARALLCCLPETRETTGLLGAAELALLARPALVVNVGRGAIFNEEALYHALVDGTIHAAGLDVWWQYPENTTGEIGTTRPSRFDFHELPNVVMSPHRGGLTQDDKRLRMEALARLLTLAHEGKSLPNRMDLSQGY